MNALEEISCGHVGLNIVRAKSLGLSKGSAHAHAPELGVCAVAGNVGCGDSSVTEQALSQSRKVTLPGAASVFKDAITAARVVQMDVAAAVGQDPGLVSRWCTGRRSIPSDCVWALMRSLPELGIEILLRCAAELPAKWLVVFKVRVAEMEVR